MTHSRRRQSFRRRLAFRDGPWCHYCLVDLPLYEPHTGATISGCGDGWAGIDHKEPLSRGGSDTLDNMVLCCRPCNDAKADMSYAEFMRAKGV